MDRVVNLMCGATSTQDEYDGLTKREVEILRMLASGRASKQVAYSLEISEKTVRNNVTHIYDKLGIGDRAQVVFYAIRKGLIEP